MSLRNRVALVTGGSRGIAIVDHREEWAFTNRADDMAVIVARLR